MEHLQQTVVSQFEFEHSEYQWVICQTETLPSDRLEAANAQRIGYLAELARVRHTTLDAIMSELGLTSDSHGLHHA